MINKIKRKNIHKKQWINYQKNKIRVFGKTQFLKNLLGLTNWWI